MSRAVVRVVWIAVAMMSATSMISAPALARGKGGGGIGARCVPSFGEATLTGMRCTDVRTDSILGKAGVKDGDVLTSVSGQPTLSPRDLMNSIALLRRVESAEIKVLREGKEQVLTYTK